MSAELTMPKLSDSVADAVILRWLKAPGEGFKRGEALLEVETDKATVVYEAEDDGTLESILVQEGEAAAVGQPIASLGGGGAAEAANRATDAGARPNATPVARRTAVELGVSLHDVAGTGPGGRITSDDVQRAAAALPAATAETAQGPRGDVRVVELTATQATIARRMAQSAAEIPSFTVSADADMTEVVALRRGAREESSQAPSLNDFVVKAAAIVLARAAALQRVVRRRQDRVLLTHQRRRGGCGRRRAAGAGRGRCRQENARRDRSGDAAARSRRARPVAPAGGAS